MVLDLGEYGAPARRVPPQARARRARSPRAAVAVLVAAALVAVADVRVAAARRGTTREDSGPTAAAQRFYDAVRAGDARTALSLLDLPRATDRRLLTAAALARTTGLPPAGATLVAHHGDDATVDVDYTLAVGGAPVSAGVELVLHRSYAGVLHDRPRWRVTRGLPTVLVRAAPGIREAVVAGATVPLGAGGTELPSFPGLVPVSVLGSVLFAATSVELAGGAASDPASQTLLPGPSDAARDAGATAVLTAFAGRTDRLPDGALDDELADGVDDGSAGSVVLHGRIEQRDAVGDDRRWTTTVTVREADGRLVASDVTIAPAPAG